MDSKGFVHNRFYNLAHAVIFDSAFPIDLSRSLGSIKDESYNNIVC